MASLVLWLPLALAAGGEGSEAEEPDFFFLTGGPYTQKKNSPQVIWANQWFWDANGSREAHAYVGGGRAEWGLTDRWEVDFEFGALRLREQEPGVAETTASGADDLLVGVRYRLLREPRFPFTLTLGPQVIAPVASRREGLGTGAVGYSLDLAAAKDWGGPLFMAASLNLAVRPKVPVLSGSDQEVDLSVVGWGTALGLRPLERSTQTGAHHDLHLLLEVGGARIEEVGDSDRARFTEVLFAPGLRYGFLSSAGALAEIGISFPVGLTGSSPDWGFILQLQFEMPPLFRAVGGSP
jgi:hypothetical protein